MDAATSALGTETVQASANAYPTTVTGTGAVSGLNVWGEIIPNQTPNYSTISTTQTPNWSEVA